MTSKTFKIVARICRVLLGVVFVVSGFTKVIDPWGTAIKINEYLSIYGFEYLEPCSMAFSIWLCGAEFMMGCMLLCRVRVRLVSIFAFASLIFFTLLTFLSATWIPVEDCGCFGEAIKLTPWETFAKNLIMLPMAGVVWWRYRSDRIFAFRRREIIMMIFFFLLAMGLGVYCLRHLPLIDFLPYKVGVNIHDEMNRLSSDGEDESVTVLVYRNKNTGRLREFALTDPEWQDTEKWEWVDTYTESDEPDIRPMLSEFSLRDPEGDATEEILTAEGRLYMICVTDFGKLSKVCNARLSALVAKAVDEGSLVACLTPQPLREVTWHSFGDNEVRCYNIDASTMKTMLRATTGVMILDDGTISVKMNWRDIGDWSL